MRPRSWPTKRATNDEAGAARMSSGGPNWARIPPVWKTATRSPILIASSMSWVTNRIVLAMVSWSRRNSFWSRSRTIGSTAPNGSSMSMIGGSAASARATPTRCRSPPDSWLGNRSRYLLESRPTRSSNSSERSRWRALVQPMSRGTVADVVADRLMREKPDLLDDVADASPKVGQLAGRGVDAIDEDPARRRLDEPVDHLERRRLAAARWPDETADLAGRHQQREVVDRSGCPFAGAAFVDGVVMLGDVVELDDRRRVGSSDHRSCDPPAGGFRR